MSSRIPDSAGASRRELAVSALAAAVAVVLILALGFLAGRWQVLDERPVFQPPTSSLPRLPERLAAQGRSVYVPAYSHIYRNTGETVPLAITLSVRNTDAAEPIRIDRVRYFDGDGQLVREQSEAPLVLAPMATASFLVKAQDPSGGSGANFLVDWSARESVSMPLIEAVMVGDDGLSFKSRGVAAQPEAAAARKDAHDTSPRAE
ncbi:hypothetical protein CKO31_04925 [Thiohalocapsa halophila]|uniref:DUF3124 domain-containing protein n=1 Tax=Thiohalocapsa halophila TaxID=69359 RepID=A0ABS1CDZ5_9GAMM|nr:DUF3124 domain-containing protein [Thiohalocapsa halophila]MBK1630094.1 hypothetical protein [Thiohalocapsa halophila]